MASLFGNTVARRSSDSQRSFAAMPSSPSSSRSTCPAKRLPNFVIMIGFLRLRYYIAFAWDEEAGYELAAQGRTDSLRIRRAREGQESGLERREERAGAETSPRDQEGRPPLLLPHGG